MTNAKIIRDKDTAYMLCPHEGCRRGIMWHLGRGKATRDNETKAYRWFNRQLIEHKH